MKGKSSTKRDKELAAITHEMAIEIHKVMTRFANKYPGLTAVEMMQCLAAVGVWFTDVFKATLQHG